MDFWHVYIIECKDKKLYIGITKNLDNRIKLHSKGLACRFTKYRKPVRLVYKETYNTKSEARKRELEIKGYKREKKLKLAGDRSFDG
ncbi:MAG: GIY-YIG nuclease family protein [Candidatus Omnitrophota bacterium]|nr:GIY-YIG nuclease family protein [Candidatus Omnitrophota bacterium]